MSRGRPPVSSFSIDFALMGTLNYDQLLALHESASSFRTQGWRVDWYEDILELVNRKQNSPDIIAPDEFYEKIYQITDLGLLFKAYPGRSVAFRKIDIHLHDSIVSSYQIRARFQASSESSRLSYPDLWSNIKSANNMLHNVAHEVGLYPTVDAWTVRLASQQDPGIDTTPSYQELVAILLNDDMITIESASLLKNSALIKLINAGRDQYLEIASEHEGDSFPFNIYHLMIARNKLKDLFHQLKREHVTSISTLQSKARRYHLLSTVRSEDVRELAQLRSDIIQRSEEFYVRRNHVELALSFLEFHAGAFLHTNSETPVAQNLPLLIHSENDHLQVFYLEPLRYLVQRIDQSIKQSLDSASSVMEILNIQVNLRSQKLIENLQLIAVIAALISIAVTMIGFLVQ
ncbi:hypothetical protein [Nitrolancea hollandica]|nr:hypothetical protein [Nitrolancea hollandica]